jgi:hypothetical protein
MAYIWIFKHILIKCPFFFITTYIQICMELYFLSNNLRGRLQWRGYINHLRPTSAASSSYWVGFVHVRLCLLKNRLHNPLPFREITLKKTKKNYKKTKNPKKSKKLWKNNVKQVDWSACVRDRTTWAFWKESEASHFLGRREFQHFETLLHIISSFCGKV